jgi:hypothetical protein
MLLLFFQVVGLVAAAFTLMSAGATSRSRIRFFIFGSAVSWGVHHMGMGSPGAALGSVVIAVAARRDRSELPLWGKGAFLLVALACGMLSPGLLAPLAALGTAGAVLPALVSTRGWARIGILVSNAAWLGHGILILSVGSVVTAVVSICILAIAEYRGRRGLDLGVVSDEVPVASGT